MEIHLDWEEHFLSIIRPDNIFQYYQVGHMPVLFYEKYEINVWPEMLLF